jgi:hypothetical protein
MPGHTIALLISGERAVGKDNPGSRRPGGDFARPRAIARGRMPGSAAEA